MAKSRVTDSTSDDLLVEIRDRYSVAVEAWKEVRDEAEKDMRFVGGDPWDADDKDQRKDRPTIAPEEMGQYFNAVINQLRMNPRGMKFSATGFGASEEGARFYQNKAREIEYRSHAKLAYITAAENAIQRSYGWVRVSTRYASHRSANQELWIEDMPDPDMVLPDPDAKRPDSSDMQYCFVHTWMEQREFKAAYPDAKIRNFEDFSARYPSWIQGRKVLICEYWSVETRQRQLVLIQPPAPPMPINQPGAPPVPVPRPVEAFADEVPAGAKVLRALRTVDYPRVLMRLTNGLEVLHEQEWPGQYIPLVSCYGKVLWVPEGGTTKRKILSMTRFGRDPWKAYCYACSQELEILGQVPKASVMAAAGQLDGFEQDWQEAPHKPKAVLYYQNELNGRPVPPPQRLEYTQGQYLQSLEVVKEGFRRAIQSAMGSNFLPTNAQRRNDKSGVALDKIDQAASTGTFHFVDHYDDMIRQVGVITEDLIDKVYDFAGETGVMEQDGKADRVAINDPNNPKAVPTQGNYSVTVSTGPSSDSEAEAASDFTDALIGKIDMVASVSGPKVAAAVLATGIRMRNLGPFGDKLADLVEPPEFKTQDGQAPNPQLMAAQQHIQQLTQQLTQMEQTIKGRQAEKQTEMQGKFAIAEMQETAESQRAAADREVKLAVAEMSAKIDRMALFLEESKLVGVRAHDAVQNARNQLHEVAESAKDRAHEAAMAALAQPQMGSFGGDEPPSAY